MSPAPPPDPEDPDNVVDPDVLASRRIRRAEEPPDAPLRERAAAAEQAVVSLERRLADAERRLGEAQGERAALATRLAASEHAQAGSEGEAGSETVLEEIAATARRLGAALHRLAAERALALGRLADAHAALAERELQVASRDAVAAELQRQLDEHAHGLEAEVAGLRTRVDAAERELQGRIAEERTARVTAETTATAARLAGERASAEAATAREQAVEAMASLSAAETAAAQAAAERDRLQAELTAEVERGSALRAGFDRDVAALVARHEAEVALLRAEGRHGEDLARWTEEAAAYEARIVEREKVLRAAVAELTAREDDLASRERALASLRAELEEEPPLIEGPRVALGDVPAADHPALAGRPDAQTPEQLESVIVGLARAAQRLRAERGEGAVPAPPAGMSSPGEGPPAGDPHALDDPSPVEPPPAELPVRRSAADLVRPSPWLGAALQALAAEQPDVACRLLLAFLPVQAGRARRPVRYELAPDETSTVVVSVDEERVATEIPGDEDGGVDFVVSGPTSSLVPLVAGGASRRTLAGATVAGRKRRLRGLLRGLGDPVSLDELARAHAHAAPRDLLVLLTVGAPALPDDVAPARVAFALGDDVPTVAVTLAPGTPLRVADDAEPGTQDAVVRTTPAGFLPMLAGTAAAEVEGDADAARAALRALDAAQRLA